MKLPYKIVLIFFLWTCHQHPLVSGRFLVVTKQHDVGSRQRRHGDDRKKFETSITFHNGDNMLSSSLPGGRKSTEMLPLLSLKYDGIGHWKSDILRDGDSRSSESVWQELSERLNLPLVENFLRKKSTDSTDLPKPTKPDKPTKTPKPTKSTKPPKPTKPTKPPKPSKPSKPEIIETTAIIQITTKDPFQAYCDVACDQGTAGPECDCPGHPIG